MRVPAFNIVPLPDDVDDELGAILDPLGNAVHTALSFDLVGEDVLITGAGPIGIMAGAVARHVGARHVVITDVNPTRLALAAEVADVGAVDVAKQDLRETMSRLKMTEGFDVALEMSGAPAAFDQLIDSVVTGGRVALLGLPAGPTLVDWNKVIFKQLTLKGIYGREMFETWHKMIAMLESGLSVRKVITHMITLKGIYGREMFDTWYAMSQMIATSDVFRAAVAQVITHRFPAEEWEQAFATARSGQCGKVVLDWS